MEEIKVNTKPLSTWGARALGDFKIGGTQFQNQYIQGRNRTHYTLLSQTFGLKPLEMTLIFSAPSRSVAELNRSLFLNELYGVSEIQMPNGLFYRSMINKVSDETTEGADEYGVKITQKYSFLCVEHGEMITVADGTSVFYSEGTMPKMDARLTVTATASADNYTLAGAQFKNVSAGDVLVFDGINKRALKNGAPAPIYGYFEFPSVIPGANSFPCVDPVTVEYYPCYL